MSVSFTTELSRNEWLERVNAHQARLGSFVEEQRRRLNRGDRHAVYDFLFTYYSFSGGQLLRWTPGLKVHVEANSSDPLEWPDHFCRTRSGFFLDPARFPARRLPFLRWAIRFLKATAARPPVFHCFGLHEWAMVYRAPEKRYPNIPLRVTNGVLEEMVEASPLRCTHYDAFRFFSEAAVPLNRVQLTADSVIENDQPGCIHATMDLYRLAYKIAPYTPSELLGDLFLLARDAREIDMRASPYDLSSLGFRPIPIESKEGREEYVEAQRSLSERAAPYRTKLCSVYELLLTDAAVHAGDGPISDSSAGM